MVTREERVGPLRAAPGDLFGNQKETACQENHHARKKDEPHAKSNAQMQSDRREAPDLPGAA
jgi:hypothetical protein